jgi:hypothetical protein
MVDHLVGKRHTKLRCERALAIQPMTCLSILEACIGQDHGSIDAASASLPPALYDLRDGVKPRAAIALTACSTRRSGQQRQQRLSCREARRCQGPHPSSAGRYPHCRHSPMARGGGAPRLAGHFKGLGHSLASRLRSIYSERRHIRQSDLSASHWLWV